MKYSRIKYGMIALAASASALLGISGCNEGLEGKVNNSPSGIERRAVSPDLSPSKGVYVPPSANGQTSVFYNCNEGVETIWVKDKGNYRPVPTDRNCR